MFWFKESQSTEFHRNKLRKLPSSRVIFLVFEPVASGLKFTIMIGNGILTKVLPNLALAAEHVEVGEVLTVQ